MRCAPYALAFDHNHDLLQEVSRDSSRITHADPRCQHGCAALNLVLAQLLADRPNPVEQAVEELDTAAPDEVVAVLERVVDGTSEPHLSNSGYVIHTLEAGLHHGLTAETAEDAIVSAVMMGGDTDTIAAVAGSVAGARCGAEAIPERWLSPLPVSDELENLSTTLAAMITPPRPVSYPAGQQRTECAICGDAFESYTPGFASGYANLVCEACDNVAVTEADDRPQHGAEYVGEEPVYEKDDGTTVINSGPDAGDNPVYINGNKCWRRYRFGGWITRWDEHDCNSLEEFQHTHRGLPRR
jgi:hypothetical protein